jgi:hypothetical protein
MEAIFGARMALRQEQVRATIGSGDLAELLREAGLPARDRVTLADVPTGQLLAELAPPAPTGRYALGTGLRAEASKRRFRPVPWWTATAVASGSIAGALITLVVLASRAKPGPVVVHAAATPPPAVATPTSRRVVLPLPFLATRVTFDEATRDLDPATDVVAFEVPADADPRHRVTIVALDGTRADGLVRERDGIGRPEGDGYAFVGPPGSADVEPRSGGVHPGRPIGTVRNGFTKLR